MTVPARSQKNIWVAAGDGDLARVQELVEEQSLSPNVPDAHTYTPMHAAASYGQLEVLAYLISHGGDVNVIDNDGDTPLYTVEDVETARFLVDHGAIVDRRNIEGISPIDHLSEDFAEVASYLQSVSPAAGLGGPTQAPWMPSQYHQSVASEQLTSALLASAQDIMQRADAEGRDPEEELRQAVSRAVLEGVAAGFEMAAADEDGRERGEAGDVPDKRPKTDDGPV